ncbi:MAG TPA: CHAD domain-containing protein [Chloroflexia bacterium]|nr:CHAD domain-containing protein [Chloroflexia bacterium]
MTRRNRNGSKLISTDLDNQENPVEEVEIDNLERRADEILVVVDEPVTLNPDSRRDEPVPTAEIISPTGETISSVESPAPTEEIVSPTGQTISSVPAPEKPRSRHKKGISREVETQASEPESESAAPQHSDQEDHVVPMSGDAPLAEAGRGFLYHQYHKLRKAEPVAREGSDPEGVHDMRVATRRLRAGLQILEGTVYRPKKAERFRRQLRALANALGDTRDTDVFIQHLEKYAENLSEAERAGLEPLFSQLHERRRHSGKAMLKTLDSPKTEKLFDKLKTFVTTEGAGVLEDRAGKNEVAPSLVRHFAGSAIWQRYEEVLAYETEVKPTSSVSAPVATLHRLRVACKHLRYTLEFFEDALPPEASELHDQLVEVQDDLGELHDNQVALEMATPLIKADKDNQVLKAYRDSREEEMEKLYADFAQKWQVLAGTEFRRKLAAAIAGIGPA